ncbi:MAG: prolipoprotein diacylglyceryl transferase [Proteobacteria bacterium]|nr:prolipoprotein diacylglyceryl transferase [Pseudomonadota bacterium]
MRPILFSIGNWHVASYGLFVTLAYIAGVWYCWGRREKMGLSTKEFWDAFLSVSVGALVGGRLGALLFYSGWTPKEMLSAIIHFRGGFSFYHGFWSAALAAWLFCLYNKKSFGRGTDYAAPSLPLAHAIGRFGCFLIGCCYGRPTASVFGVSFPKIHSALPAELRGIAIHPVQLYEAFGNLAIALFLHILVKREVPERAKPGTVFWTYILSYAVLRFTTDPFRADDDLPARTLTTGQWDAIFSAGAALAFFAWAYGMSPKTDKTAAAS